MTLHAVPNQHLHLFPHLLHLVIAANDPEYSSEITST